MKVDTSSATPPPAEDQRFSFLEKLYEAVPTSIITTATDLTNRTTQAVPASVTSAVTSAVASTVESLKAFSEPLVEQHRAALVTLDAYACKGLDSSLNAIHNTAKTVNATRTSVESTVASARVSADAHLATIESTALALAAPAIVSSVNAVDNAIDRFIPSTLSTPSTTTAAAAAADKAPEYQFAPLPSSPKSPSALPKYTEDEAEANAVASAAPAAPFGSETKKWLQQIEAVCTTAQFRVRERALTQVQFATARTETVVAQLKTNTVDLLAYAKKIGADGYGYVTSEEAAADAKVVAVKASKAAADLAAKTKAATTAAVAKAEAAMPAPVIDQAKRVAELLTEYYAKGLNLAKEHEVTGKVSAAAAVFYGHVERLTRGPHRDQILAFLLRRTQADAATADEAAADGGGGGAAAADPASPAPDESEVGVEADVEAEAEAAVHAEVEEAVVIEEGAPAEV